MRKDDPVVAILCSDLHLCHKRPVARGEADWYGVMAGRLGQLSCLAEDVDNERDVPILCAGDIFDSWNSCPELINFAIKHLPKMYAIPGQHDLPMHNYADVEKSAYWTLVEAGRITDLSPGITVPVGRNLYATGFPWESKITHPVGRRVEGTLEIALIHAYVWESDKTSYPGAKKCSKYTSWLNKLKGYDVAVFGDNHKGFIARGTECKIFNCGAFLRRKSDEREYTPMVGLLTSSGDVIPEFLDGDDVFVEEKEIVRQLLREKEFDKFVHDLSNLSTSTFDFREAVELYLDGVHDPTHDIRNVIFAALEKKRS